MNSDIVILLHNIKCLYFLYFLPIGSHAFHQLLSTYTGVFEELTSPWRLPRRRKMSRRLLRHPEDGWGSRHFNTREVLLRLTSCGVGFILCFFSVNFFFFTVGEFKNLIMSSLQLGFIKSVKSFLFWSLERFHLGFHISVHLHSLFVYHFYPHTSILFLGARADTWPTLLTEKMFIEHSRVPLLWR